MLDDLWRDFGSWGAGLPPEWVFLFSLPFVVAGVAFAGQALRTRRRTRERSRVTARLSHRTLLP
jgi:hypothetical protein